MKGLVEATPSEQGAKAPEKKGDVVIPPVSFARASDVRLMPAGVDVQRLIDANTFDPGVQEITSYGWAKGVWLRVTSSGGAAGLNNAVLREDGVFTALGNLALTEPNGREHVATADVYNLFLANKYGGYFPQYASDPRGLPGYTTGGNGGNLGFWLWIPLEVSERSGMGSQSNMDDTGKLKLRFQFNAAGTIWSTQPDTKPTIRVRAYLSAWDPVAEAAAGMMNQTTPPAAGLTQYWTVQSGIAVAAGENSINLKRKGNYIRNIGLVLRRAGTSRANGEADWPDELRFVVDEFPKKIINDDWWLQEEYLRSGNGGAGVTVDTVRGHENGVRWLSFCHDFDGAQGRELREQWLPTIPTTSIKLEGNFANAGTLTVITNDIAIPNGRESEVFM